MVCCPTDNLSNTRYETKQSIFEEKCNEYIQYSRDYKNNPVTMNSDNNFFHVTVVGGKNANPKEFPHMALIGYGKTLESVRWSCGGSLISHRWILSAAHCEKLNSLSARWVRLGDLDIESDTDDAQPVNYDIIRRVVHPDFKPPSRYNDIALFYLDKDVDFSEYILPLCLNANHQLYMTNLIATGWGLTSTGGPPSSHLQKVDLDLISMDKCKASYGITKLLNIGIHNESQLCAGSETEEKDTCQGDSGGPLQIVHPKYKQMYVQVGITSFGEFCADKEKAGVYTKILHYLPWIEKIVWPSSNAFL
ncbi:venom protease-like [Daktulosphaira vitifoliae]|nr:venom protease-like [Daktulosphaira vitifoliae]